MKRDYQFGFYISDLRHFDYFNNVLNSMGKSGLTFALIINDYLDKIDSKFSADYSSHVIETAEKTGYAYFRLSSLKLREIHFQYAVSTYTFRYKTRVAPITPTEAFLHKLSKLNKRLFLGKPDNFINKLVASKRSKINEKLQQFPEQSISNNRIFFPKGMDLHIESFPDDGLIELNEVFLCHGQIDNDLISKKTNKRTFQIGYPRYDNFWDLNEEDLEDLRNEFKLNPNKKIVSWIPTYGPIGDDLDYNINKWLPEISKLTTHYEVIVRPHPKRISNQAENLINKLQALGLHVDLVTERDMSKLYKVSDYVLCDSGGVVFSAIYTNSKLLILSSVGQQSSDEKSPFLVNKVKKSLPTIFIEDVESGKESVVELLENEDFWNNTVNGMKRLRELYFGNILDGKGAEEVVKVFQSLVLNPRKSNLGVK